MFFLSPKIKKKLKINKKNTQMKQKKNSTQTNKQKNLLVWFVWTTNYSLAWVLPWSMTDVPSCEVILPQQQVK